MSTSTSGDEYERQVAVRRQEIEQEFEDLVGTYRPVPAEGASDRDMAEYDRLSAAQYQRMADLYEGIRRMSASGPSIYYFALTAAHREALREAREATERAERWEGRAAAAGGDQ